MSKEKELFNLYLFTTNVCLLYDGALNIVPNIEFTRFSKGLVSDMNSFKSNAYSLFMGLFSDSLEDSHKTILDNYDKLWNVQDGITSNVKKRIDAWDRSSCDGLGNIVVHPTDKVKELLDMRSVTEVKSVQMEEANNCIRLLLKEGEYLLKDAKFCESTHLLLATIRNVLGDVRFWLQDIIRTNGMPELPGEKGAYTMLEQNLRLSIQAIDLTLEIFKFLRDCDPDVSYTFRVGAKMGGTRSVAYEDVIDSITDLNGKLQSEYSSSLSAGVKDAISQLDALAGGN